MMALRLRSGIGMFVLFMLVHSNSSAQPKLSCPEERIELGPVLATKEHTVQFEISNEGDEPLRLNLKSKSCTCTVTSIDELIDPSASGYVYATLEDITVGGFQLELVIGTNDPGKPELSLAIGGEGVERAIYARSVEFTQGEKAGDGSIEFSIFALGDVPDFSIESTEATVPWIDRVSVAPAGTEEGERYRIKYRISAPIQGACDEAIFVRTDYPLAPLVELPIRMTVEGPYTVSPPELILSSDGEVLTKACEISRKDKVGFRLLSIDTDVADAELKYEQGEQLKVSVSLDGKGPSALRTGKVRVTLEGDDLS